MPPKGRTLFLAVCDRYRLRLTFETYSSPEAKARHPTEPPGLTGRHISQLLRYLPIHRGPYVPLKAEHPPKRFRSGLAISISLQGVVVVSWTQSWESSDTRKNQPLQAGRKVSPSLQSMGLDVTIASFPVTTMTELVVTQCAASIPCGT